KDEDDNEYDDDDEDDATTTWTPLQPTAAAASQPNLPRISASLSDFSLTDFQVDILFVVLIVAYLAIHYFCRRLNEGVAKSWLQSTIATWSAQFAHFGDENKYTLVRDGPDDFIFYASGRRFVEKAFGFIRLSSRYDPVALITNYVYGSTSYDRVDMEFTLDSKLEGLVFAILDKKKATNLRKGRYDLTDFAATKTHPRLPKDHYVLATDCIEFANAVMQDDDFVGALWASVGLKEGDTGKGLKDPLFESIIVTDQKLKVLPDSVDELKTVCRKVEVTVLIPDKKQEDIPKVQIEGVMNLIDTLGEFSASGEAKATLKKIRLGCEEKVIKKGEEKRKEELAKLKQEAQKKKEDDISKLSAAEQRKYHEKKQKEEAKKRMKKQGKVSVSF
ncbi:hypothetical protein HK405_003693, partial [Cladochytrium tenue]